MQREREREREREISGNVFYFVSPHYSKYKSSRSILSQRSEFVLTHFPPVAKLCIDEAC